MESGQELVSFLISRMIKTSKDSERGDEDGQRHRKPSECRMKEETWTVCPGKEIMEGNIQEGYKIMGGVMVDGELVFQSKDHLTSSCCAGSGEQQATH